MGNKFTHRVLILLFAIAGAGQLFGQIDYEVLTGAAETTGGTSGYQLNSYWHDCRCESVYLRTELNAAGVVGSVPISAISLRCAQVPGKNLENLRIRMKHTTSATTNASYQTGYTSLYGPTTLTPTVFTVGSWYKFNFTTPFIWDGTSNIIVDYSVDGTSWTSGGMSYQRTVSGARTTPGYSDSSYTYPFSGMESATRSTVPSIKFTVDGLSIVTPAILPSGAEGTSYTTNIQASQGTTPYTWTHITASGPLPTGLSIAQVNDEFRITGTPATGTSGTYNFDVRVTDNASDTYQKTMTLYIMPPPASMPFSDDFSSDTGWQYDTGWQRGSATAYSGASPPRTEPGTDNSPTSDNMIAGHLIGADYAASMGAAVWLTSPPVDCSTASTVSLRFYRWLGCSLGDTAKIQVTNNGSTWNDV
ncbi:MAG: Ig domain-containing protein, partial [Planctomycetota bacterium]